MYNYYQQREFENNRAEKNLEDAKKYLQYIYIRMPELIDQK